MLEQIREFERNNQILDCQKMALTISAKNLSQTPNFTFQEFQFLNNLILIFGKIDGEECFILPVYHDWKLESEQIAIFSHSFSDKKKFLGMCAPDSSFILYSIKEFDWQELETIDDDPNSD